MKALVVICTGLQFVLTWIGGWFAAYHQVYQYTSGRAVPFLIVGAAIAIQPLKRWLRKKVP